MQAFTDPDATDEAVYRVIESVPAGRVTSYGQVAAWLGLSTARRPAAAMRRAPEGVPWWRIVRSDGTFPESLRLRALPHWAEEATPQGPHGVAAAAFWNPDPEALGALRASVQDLRAPQAQG